MSSSVSGSSPSSPSSPSSQQDVLSFPPLINRGNLAQGLRQSVNESDKGRLDEFSRVVRERFPELGRPQKGAPSGRSLEGRTVKLPSIW